MVVVLAGDQLQYIVAHARTTYPEECCGFLIGRNTDQRSVQRVLAARNAATPSRAKRYQIDPNELLHAHEEASRSNLELIGVYHSHPDAPVEPSQFDLEYAWPSLTYIVVSLQGGEPRDIGAWYLDQTARAFELDELKVVQAPEQFRESLPTLPPQLKN